MRAFPLKGYLDIDHSPVADDRFEIGVFAADHPMHG